MYLTKSKEENIKTDIAWLEGRDPIGYEVRNDKLLNFLKGIIDG